MEKILLSLVETFTKLLPTIVERLTPMVVDIVKETVKCSISSQHVNDIVQKEINDKKDARKRI